MSELKNISPGLIYSLIPKVMADVGAIEKAKKNQQQNYKFRGIDDVFAAFQPVLARHQIFYVPEVLASTTTDRETNGGKTMIYTNLQVAYTFYATDGSSVRAVVVGEASDMADKSSNKAMSAALKYALLQIFCVPTEELAQDDADNHTHENGRRTVSAHNRPQMTRPETDRFQATANQRQERADDRPTRPEPQAAGDAGGDDRGFNCPLGLVDAYNRAVAALEAASVAKADWRAKVREVLELESDAHLDMRDLNGPQMSKAVNALNAMAKAAKTATAGAR